MDEEASRRRRAGRPPGNGAVRVASTRIGKGVVSRRWHKPGALIGEIQGQIIDDPHYGSDYCMGIGEDKVIEPSPPFRYLNHSCEPNCQFDWFDVASDGESQPRRRVFLFAVTTIQPGDELTIAYNWPSTDTIACRCCAPSCRGQIISAGEYARLNGQSPNRGKSE